MVLAKRLELPKFKFDVFQSGGTGGFWKNNGSISNTSRIFHFAGYPKLLPVFVSEWHKIGTFICPLIP
jgi:hypothetical protein